MTEKKIDAKLLQQAIQVLRNINDKHYGDSSNKRKLFEEEKESAVYLQFSLKKIPKCKTIKMIKINLPHSLVKDNSELCMITGDLDKKDKKAEIEPDRLYFKDLLKKHGINNISEVVTLRQLRTEYKPYEAKQKLLAAYDVFLTDRKIAECLPRVLGRHFFRKRKFPIQITLNTPNLKQQIEKALSTKVFYLTGHGNSCNSEVAYLSMSDEEISENVVAMVKALCDKLPGSWDNVMGIYLKTSLSKAIPVYISYDDPNKIHLEEENNDRSYEIDELSTCPNSLVKVYRDGSVRTVRLKRMAEDESYETTAIVDLEKKKKKKKDTNDLRNMLETEDLNDETTAIVDLGKKKKKKKGTGDLPNMLETADLNDETTAIVDLGKKKKKKKDTGHLPNMLETADLNAENDDFHRDSKKKKKKSIICDNSDSLKTQDLNEDFPKTRRKSKSKQIILGESISEPETEKSVCTTKKKKNRSKENHM